MDIQLKRGILEVCVLKSLEKSPSYGYKIIKDVEGVIEISESTLYPILKRLETQQLVTVSSVEHNGRLRKYYTITIDGMKKIDDFITEWQTITDIIAFIKGDKINEQN